MSFREKGLTLKVWWRFSVSQLNCTQDILELNCHLMVFFLSQSLCQHQFTISHLDCQLFVLHVHSWSELCHLLSKSNQLPFPRAHIHTQLGNADITPEIIGGEAGMSRVGKGGCEGEVWRRRGQNREERLTEAHNSYGRQTGRWMENIRQLSLSVLSKVS